MTDWSKFLNKEQCDAVTAADGPVLVLAAAGTGKTRTLTYRVAFLQEQGVKSDEILLLTFTNRAAKEMLERAAKLTKGNQQWPWSGTFHHVCSKMLRKFANKIGYSQSFTILDHEDSINLIEKNIKAIVADRQHFPKKAVIASIISSHTNIGTQYEKLIENLQLKFDVTKEQLEEIEKLYTQTKLTENYMDFDDLLTNGLRLLKEFPDILNYYGTKFRYILVDEYQDSNKLQAEFVDMLASVHRNLMVVGDDFQCIYSWRGADFRSIIDFPKRWADAKIIKIEQNYRSSPEILGIANATIQGNIEQFQKELRATCQSNVKPVFIQTPHVYAQNDYVVKKIKEALKNGCKPSDIAILYRAHYLSVDIQNALVQANIPYYTTSGVGIYETVHGKDILAFLRICCGEPDVLSFIRFLKLLPGVGEKTAEKIWNKVDEKFNIANLEHRKIAANAIPKKAKDDWAIINSIFEEFITENYSANGNKIVGIFLDRFYQDYIRRSFENPDERIDELNVLTSQIPQGMPISVFLEDVALQTKFEMESDNTAISEENRVRLTTIHQAKGLEWKIVFIIWVNETIFPSAKALENGDDSEERRLFYVAVTRAKEELTLLAPYWMRMRDGSQEPLNISRFVNEIPVNLFDVKQETRNVGGNSYSHYKFY